VIGYIFKSANHQIFKFFIVTPVTHVTSKTVWQRDKSIDKN